MSLYSDASLIVYPSGYKESKIYAQKPIDGTGDLTFTRASSATRVNEQGLIETASVLGSELVTNGDFATDITGWIQYSSVSTWDDGTIKTTVNSVNAYIRTNTFTLTGGIRYKVTFKAKASNVSQNIIIYNGATFFNTGLTFDVANTYQEFTYYLDNIASANLIVGQQSLSIGDSINFDNVSVKEVITSNVPRIDYTNGCGSLLLEPQRTNLLQYSESFITWWVLNGATVTYNQGIAPDGSNNAIKIDFSTATPFAELSRSSIDAAPSGKTYTFFSYVKGIVGEKINLYMDANGQVGAGVSITFNGSWQRVSVTNVYPASSNFALCRFTNRNLGGGVTGLGTATVFQAWGFQVEQGSYPTSLIPTSGTTVTRVKDTSSTTGLSSVIGQTEGTWQVKFTKDNIDTYRILTMQNAAGTDKLNIYTFNDDLRVGCTSGGSSQFELVVSSAIGSGTFNVAFAYKSNDFNVYLNGVSIYTNTSASVPSGMDRIYFSQLVGGNLAFNHRVDAVTLFKTRLTNTELATLTTL